MRLAALALLVLLALTVLVVGVALAAPPAADFAISDTTPEAGESVTFTSTSTDVDGDIAGWEWDFDYTGTFTVDATGASAATAYSAPGSYSVALRVTDAASEQAIAVRALTVATPNTPPIGSFTFGAVGGGPGAGIDVGQAIRFTGTGSDPDGDPVTFEWSFGDGGTATGADATHAYATPGAKTVTMTVRDNRGGTGTAQGTVVVDAPPVATISSAPESPVPGEPVTFVGSASTPTGRPISAMQWDFDFDASSGRFDVDASGPTVSRAFTAPGPKTVALRVEDVGGRFATVTRTLTVNAPPRAGFTVTPDAALVGAPVTLASTASDPDGQLVRQDWDLDADGRFDDADGPVVFSTFGAPGTYPVRLRVTDARGATALASREVVVRPRAPALLSGVVVTIRGRLVGKQTRVTRLVVRAPKGSAVSARCAGPRCPRRARTTVERAKPTRIRRFERRYRAGTVLTVTVGRNGFLGRRTTFTIRRGKAPRRRDLCIVPGTRGAAQCPQG